MNIWTPKTSMVVNFNGKERNLVGWSAYLLATVLGVFMIVGAMDVVSCAVALATSRPFDMRWGAFIIATIGAVWCACEKDWSTCIPWAILAAVAGWSLHASGCL